ncbi:MAG: hypothetical protein K0Q79_3682 [Flavipsychrobacter sp.]|jgi:class 3 adenylate cyclase|nr:hypothetical protein [Flavipsychrobacter sp.]
MRRLIFIILSLYVTTVYAQEKSKATVDSLTKQLALTKEDSNKAKLLCGISAAYGKIDVDEGVKYGTQAEALSQKIGWDKGAADAQYSIAGNYLSKGDYSKAMEYALKSLKWFETAGKTNPIHRTKQYNIVYTLASINFRIGDYPKALSYAMEALKYFESTGNKKGIADASNCIANSHTYAGNMKEGLEYYYKSLAASTEIGDGNGIAAVTSNIGDIYIKQANFDTGIAYVLRALRMNEASGNTHFQAINLFTIANAYLLRGMIPEALAYSFRSLKVAEAHEKTTIPWNYALIATCYMEIARDTMGKMTAGKIGPAGKTACLAKCVEYIGKAINIDIEAGDLQGLKDDYQTRSSAQMLLGNYKGALEDFKNYTAIKDSIYNTENNTKMSNLETKRQVELKDKQIEIDKLAVAKKRNERGFYLAGIAGLLAITGFVFRNYKTQKRSNELQIITNKQLSAEKEKSESLLLNILPAEVADELKSKGVAEARMFDMVTVLFTDFVNFTSAGERMSPKELVGELHECFQAFDNILNSYAIEKIKTIGDAYLAVSGLPDPIPDHANHVVGAAIEILHFMEERRKRLGPKTFEIRIGIHSGSVVAGIVGVKKFAYDIWGDTVNTAARMEQHGQAGMVNISETTYQLVKDKFNCEFRGEVAAKNKGTLNMYFVTV